MNALGSNSPPSLSELGDLDPPARATRVMACADPPCVLDALHDALRGMIHDDLDGAVAACAWLPALADEVGGPERRVAVRAMCVTAFSYANRFNEGLALLDEGRAIAQAASDASLLARVELASVQPLARLGRLGQAIEAAERAVELYTSAGDEVAAGKAHSNLGVLHRMGDDPARALRHFDLALPSLAGDPMGVAQIETNRAVALLNLCRFEEAERAFRQAIGAFSDAGAARAGGIAEGNLADLLGRQGKLQASLRHYEQATRVLERSDAPGDAARLTAERAEVLAAIGALEDALDGFDHAIAGLDAAGLIQEATRARASRGVSLGRLGRLEEAESALGEVAARHTLSGNRTALAMTNSSVAELMSKRGAASEARGLLRASRAALAEHPSGLAGALAIEAELEVRDGQPDRALPLLAEAMQLCADMGNAPLQARLIHTRGSALRALGRLPEAIEALRDAVERVERQRGTLGADRLRAAWLGDRLTVYADLVAAALDHDERANAGLAFTTLERAKCRSLLDMVQGGIALAEQVVGALESPEEARLLARLSGLRSELNALYARVGGEHGVPGLRGPQGERVVAIERDIAHIEGRLASTRRFGEIFGTPAELDDVRAILPPATALVEYTSLGGELGAFVVRDDGVHLARSLCSLTDLAAASSRVSFQIDRAIAGGASDTRAVNRTIGALQKLHDLVLAPLRDAITDAERLVIVPAGDLFGVAMHALHDGESFLIERSVVSYSPSASLLVSMHARRVARRGEGALVAGVSDEAAPRIEEEVRRVGDLLAGTTLVGDQATSTRVFEMARSCGLLHIASHGLFADRAPLDAAIKLADRWVTARDVFALDLPGSVVVLSSCDAGRNAVHAGDEVYGLGRAFLAAGASGLVTSLWSAHDDTTIELMSQMYDGFVKDKSPQRSIARHLAGAQRSLLERETHPAHWAPFVCAGEL